MIKTYRKTATIQAEQFDGSDEMMRKYHLVNGKDAFRFNSHIDPDKIYIATLEGNFEIAKGDWIATGIQGEHWVIADDVFKETYVESEDSAIDN